jgi:two-component system, NarL family, response regulator DesR
VIVRVLIADDNREIRSALALVLRELWGECEIEQAGDGAETLAVLQTYAPDLVLLDWSLAGAEVRELVAHLKERDPGCAVVAMSSSPEAHPESLKAGADDFVGTSEPPAHLFEVLRRLEKPLAIP